MIIFFLFFVIFTSADETGILEADCTYKYTNSIQELRISGNGQMPDFDFNDQPWNLYKADIKIIVIEDGITTIGKYSFYDCVHVESISIGNDVQNIENKAFENCFSLKSFSVGQNSNFFKISSKLFYFLRRFCTVLEQDSTLWTIQYGRFS